MLRHLRRILGVRNGRTGAAMELGLQRAIKLAFANKTSRNYPNREDARYRNGTLFPVLKPKFQLDLASDKPVFTIGSCFARNIEEALAPLGVPLPTREFKVPKAEWTGRSNGLLNEYNPGSISQKILQTVNKKTAVKETIIEHSGSFHDLLLCGGAGVTLERALERRREIDDVYANMLNSEVVIITLGFVECWVDLETRMWLNRMPTVEKSPDKKLRFLFKRLGVADALPMLEEAMAALQKLDKKVILTVSPVPMSGTFSGQDCVMANEYSKAVLRVCAQELCANFSNVDYYPSYEMVRTAGLSVYEDDNVHVLDSVVQLITEYMLSTYATS